MKLESKGGKVLSLKKNTIAFLDKKQSNLVKGGGLDRTIRDGGGGIPETCGYACGDCMSTMNHTIILCTIPQNQL
jgi:hypothetical protein